VSAPLEAKEGSRKRVFGRADEGGSISFRKRERKEAEQKKKELVACPR